MRKFLIIPWMCGILVAATFPADAAALQGIGTQFAGPSPVARLSVSPTAGQAPFEVRADASASTGSGIWPIDLYSFDFGDGTGPVGAPLAAPIVHHTFRSSGHFTVTVFVMDVGGSWNIAAAEVTVSLPPGDFPPETALSVSPSTGEMPLTVTADASGSTDGDSSPIASYLFDFGDGSPRIGPSGSPTAQHLYSFPGTFTVTVFVTDTAGLQSNARVPVTVMRPELAPVAALYVSPSTGPSPLEVSADASGSTDLDATPIATYLFDFGDGSPAVGPSDSPTAQHLYSAEGEYTVTVTVTDTGGLSTNATARVTVAGAPDFPPAAALSVSPSSGPAPLSVLADASGSADLDATPIATYLFDFGDGTPTVGPLTVATAYHTYDVPGTRTVTVTVTDTAGLQSTASAQVRVFPQADYPPLPVLVVLPSSGAAPLAVTADASGSTDADPTPIATYLFDFGDSSPTIGPLASPRVQHIYTVPGTYTVTVFVTDTAGQRSSTSKSVEVSQPSLVRNPGFESDTAGWKSGGSGTQLERVIGGHSGAWAARLSNTGTAPANCVLNDVPNWVAVTSQGTYRGSVWVRADTPGAKLKLRFREFWGGGVIASAWSIVSLSTSWLQVTLNYTPAAPGLSSLDFNVLINDAPPGICFYVDDASLEFFSGASAGNAPPIAALSVNPASGPAPLSVTADASASIDADSSPIGTYLFFFGDGTAPLGPQAAATASHSFRAPGTYSVVVIVVDTLGLASSATTLVDVSVPAVDHPPQARILVVPSAGAPPLTVTADASASVDPDTTPIATYLFDFGDGTQLVGPQAGATAQHTYASTGVYTVTVTVSDTVGLAASATAAVAVSEPGEIAGNSGFEVDAIGWMATNDSVLLERVGGGHSGAWAARLSNHGAQPVTCGLKDSPNWVARTAPGSYLGSLWVRADSPGATLKLQLRESSGGSIIGSRILAITLGTAWQQVTTSYVPVAPGLSTLDFKAYISNAPPGACFYADDASITLR